MQPVHETQQRETEQPARENFAAALERGLNTLRELTQYDGRPEMMGARGNWELSPEGDYALLRINAKSAEAVAKALGSVGGVKGVQVEPVKAPSHLPKGKHQATVKVPVSQVTENVLAAVQNNADRRVEFDAVITESLFKSTTMFRA